MVDSCLTLVVWVIQARHACTWGLIDSPTGLESAMRLSFVSLVAANARSLHQYHVFDLYPMLCDCDPTQGYASSSLQQTQVVTQVS
jgi:hypothetical protein